MASFKKIVKSEAFRTFACALGALYIWFVHATSRWTLVRAEIPEAFWKRGDPFILCFWHGRLLMMPYCWDRRHRIHMLISDHTDGRLVAETVTHFGIESVVGSSSRGGATAFRSLIRLLRARAYVGLTPDGPRGPRMRAQEGAVALARHSGFPVIPIAYSARRRRVLTSWDRFLIMWPFTRGVFVWGEPLDFGPHALGGAEDGGRRALEDAINAVTVEADRLCGHVPVEPAPEAGSQR